MSFQVYELCRYEEAIKICQAQLNISLGKGYTTFSRPRLAESSEAMDGIV